MDVETKEQFLSLQNRYILTSFKGEKIAFLSELVSEIIVVEKRQILSLPMYDRSLLGIVHHQGDIVPLVVCNYNERTGESNLIKETLIAIRLSQLAKQLEGVGVIVHRILGSLSKEQIDSEKYLVKIWQPESIDPETWQAKI